MRWRDVGELECSIARTLSVIGDRWTLLILRNVFLGHRRFDEFQKGLDITRHRLADRLAKLVEHGVLKKVPLPDHPSWHEYRLTEKGRDLYGIVAMLARWGDRWMAGPRGVPVERVHKACGHVAALQLTCEHCGAAVTARDMEPRPGPAFRRGRKPTTKSARRTA